MSDSFRRGKRIATVRLEPIPDRHWWPYYCPDCGKIMFFRNGELVAEQPGQAPVSLGVQIACKNKECGKVIIVEGFSIKQ